MSNIEKARKQLEDAIESEVGIVGGGAYFRGEIDALILAVEQSSRLDKKVLGAHGAAEVVTDTPAAPATAPHDGSGESRNLEDARTKVLGRLCDCEATAKYGHSMAECMSAGVRYVDDLILAAQQQAQQASPICRHCGAELVCNTALREELEGEKLLYEQAIQRAEAAEQALAALTTSAPADRPQLSHDASAILAQVESVARREFATFRECEPLSFGDGCHSAYGNILGQIGAMRNGHTPKTIPDVAETGPSSHLAGTQPRPDAHDCKEWAMEGLGCAHCNPAALESVGWQPIDSAPKDGTVILGYDRLNTAAQSRNCVEFVSWCGDCWQDPETWTINPTHWMPLPSPPQPSEEP